MAIVAFLLLTGFSFPTRWNTSIIFSLILSLHRLYHTPNSFIRDPIIAGNFSQRFALVNAMKNDWCSSSLGYVSPAASKQLVG